MAWREHARKIEHTHWSFRMEYIFRIVRLKARIQTEISHCNKARNFPWCIFFLLRQSVLFTRNQETVANCRIQKLQMIINWEYAPQIERNIAWERWEWLTLHTDDVISLPHKWLWFDTPVIRRRQEPELKYPPDRIHPWGIYPSNEWSCCIHWTEERWHWFLADIPMLLVGMMQFMMAISPAHSVHLL